MYFKEKTGRIIFVVKDTRDCGLQTQLSVSYQRDENTVFIVTKKGGLYIYAVLEKLLYFV